MSDGPRLARGTLDAAFAAGPLTPAKRGWAALAKMTRDGSVTSWPASLKATERAYRDRVLVRCWCAECADGKPSLIAAVFSLGDGNALLVSSNVTPGRGQPRADRWEPAPLLVDGIDGPVTLFCNGCNGRRGPVDIHAATTRARTTHPLNISA